MRRDDGSESSNARPLLGAGLPRSERDSQHHPTGVPAVQAEARDVVEVAAARGCCARVSSRPRPPSGRSTSSCETPTPRCSSSTTSSTCHGSSRVRCASTYARSIWRRCAASLGLHQGGPRRLLHRPPRRRLPRRAADDGVGDADREEVGAPVARGVRRELNVPPLARHAGDDQAETGPGIEPWWTRSSSRARSRTSTAASAARRRRPRESSSVAGSTVTLQITGLLHDFSGALADRLAHLADLSG
jgi:hypothetical protein